MESRRRHGQAIGAMAGREVEEGDPVANPSSRLEALAKKASWVERNMERKRGIAPTIQSKMLMLEFLQRTEEESFDLHRLLRDCSSESYRRQIDALLLEERREVENLRQLAVRTLSLI